MLSSQHMACSFTVLIDPVVCVPCTYFIGLDGKPIEIVAGHHEVQAFSENLRSIVQVGMQGGIM